MCVLAVTIFFPPLICVLVNFLNCFNDPPFSGFLSLCCFFFILEMRVILLLFLFVVCVCILFFIFIYFYWGGGGGLFRPHMTVMVDWA